MINNRKIFQIGFNKCATSSIYAFFLKNKLKSVHWEEGRLAEDFFESFKKKEKPFENYSDTVVFTDMVKLTNKILLEPYKEFGYIYKWYPDSYYILNTRNITDWIKSRTNHPNLISRYQSVLNLKKKEAVQNYWMREWYEHHANVLKFFYDKPKQFLLYDMDKDDPEKIVNFLSETYSLDKALFPHYNKTIWGNNTFNEKQEVIQAVNFRKQGNLEGLRQGVMEQPFLLDQYGHPAFKKELMRLLLTQKKWKEASLLIPKSDDLGGSNWHELLFARAYSRINDIDNAKKWWNLVSKRNPNHKEAKEFFLRENEKKEKGSFEF